MMTGVTMPESNTAIQAFVKIFENKHKHDDGNGSLNDAHLQQIAGRVIQGSKEADFEYLGNPIKKFAWIMGGDGLTLFLRQSNLQALRSIGLDDQWIRKKLEDGNHFRLGVFYRPDECVLGTWDGVFSLVDSHYPNHISTKIQRHANELKRVSFDEIEAQARLSYLNGASYFDISQLAIGGNSADPRFMSEETFSKCEGTLEECRGFLYHRLNLSRLFDGSGFTKDMNGRLFVREYLQPTVPVRGIPGFQYLDLPIDIADLMPDA